MAKARLAAALKRIVLPCLLGLVLGAVSPLLAQQKSSEEWETLAGCRLITNSIVDGDSFRVAHDGREYIFRLYFVDAPEADATLTERAKDQAAYFGILTNDIPRAGALASQFTRELLAGTNFTVITRWRNALGRSRLARFYAVVLVGDKNLAEELVAHGLARIYGLRANWPDGLRSSTFINKLKNLEIAAHEKKSGIWDEIKFPRATGAIAGSASTTNTPAPASLVDLNNASYEELQKLPGIGPKLAERIMANRPYKTADDLGKVSGFGPVTLKRLKPLIRAETAAP